MTMRIALAHLGPISQLVPAMSVVEGIKKQKVDTHISWIVQEDYIHIHKYNKHIDRTITLEKFSREKGCYDLLVNLWPFFPERLKINSVVKHSIGFCFGDIEDQLYKGPLIGNSSLPNMSVLQLYFKLCGLTWKGEGYSVGYFPRTKTRKNRVGISVANANLRNYVLENLELENMKVWYIPYRKNIFRKMDEINRCKKVITDDLFTFHLTVSMRKYVYYLKTHPLTLAIETFGNGEIYTVPLNVFE